MSLFDQITAAGDSALSAKRRKLGYLPENLEKGRVAQVEKARARYKEALKDWTKTSVLENRVGCLVTACNKTLRKYHALGWIERRPAGGSVYNKRYGWEWRWKDGT